MLASVACAELYIMCHGTCDLCSLDDRLCEIKRLDGNKMRVGDDTANPRTAALAG